MKPRWTLALAAALIWSCGCSMLAGMARGEPGWRTLRLAPAAFGLDAERIVLRSRDQLDVTAWWLTPAPGAGQLASAEGARDRAPSAAGPAPDTALDSTGDARMNAATPPRPAGRATVVLVHGRGGNRADMLPRAKFLVEAGYDVLAIDLRAHGESGGEYPSPGYLEVAEIDAAVAYAHQRRMAPVVLLGYSVGAVAVLHATAAIAPVRAVIADSAFATTFSMMERVGATTPDLGLGERIGIWFISQRWLAGITARMLAWGGGQEIDPRRADLWPVLPQILVPVLLVSGDHDPIAPTDDAARMLAAIGGRHRELLVLHAGHHTHGDAQVEYERGVLRFLDSVLPPGPRAHLER